MFRRSPGEHLLLQEAGRSLSQNFVCAHVRLGRCYCRRPDGALTEGGSSGDKGNFTGSKKAVRLMEE